MLTVKKIFPTTCW